MANKDVSNGVTDEDVKVESTETKSNASTESDREDVEKNEAYDENTDNIETQDDEIEIIDGDVEKEQTENKDSEDSQKSEEKKSFFKKKDKKDKKDTQIEELTDRLKRNMAEFDNYRKRTEKEKSSMYEMGQRSIIEKILPIIDNFERGLLAVTDDEKNTPFVDGMDKVYKQLMKALEDAGVEAIETENKEFDPNLHNAVMHVEDENLGENVIAQELQKGYTHKGTVVRHSMVSVAN